MQTNELSMNFINQAIEIQIIMYIVTIFDIKKMRQRIIIYYYYEHATLLAWRLHAHLVLYQFISSTYSVIFKPTSNTYLAYIQQFIPHL